MVFFFSTIPLAIYLVVNFYTCEIFQEVLCKWPEVISNLTDPVPPELITVNFITKYPLLNFQSLAKHTRNAAALSAINGIIKAVENCLRLKNQQ